MEFYRTLSEEKGWGRDEPTMVELGVFIGNREGGLKKA